MAADRFTQIANSLFRDTRISLKAKGLFGLLSTHREGYGVTAKLIARQCKEGTDAIESGLRELERCGYLQRDRERRPDGTLGAVEYHITDTPTEAMDTQTSRSGPGRENPGLARPGLADPTPKKTSYKNNTGKNTTVPPSVSADASARMSDEPAATDGRNGTIPAPPSSPTQTEQRHSRRRPRPAELVHGTPGVELLRHLGAQHPGYRLTGRALVDQGQAVTRMLDAGFTPGQVRDVVTSRPLPKHITMSVGAIVSYRLREAEAAGPLGTSGAAWGLHSGPLIGDPAGGLGAAAGDGGGVAPWDRSASAHHGGTPTPPPYGQHLAVIRAECEGQDGGCGRPVRLGYDRCTDCLGLPVCACGAGRHDPARGETQCDACRKAHTTLAAVLSTPQQRPAA